MKGEASLIGPVAKAALQRSGMATTMACFDRSFYLRTDDHIICVADESLYCGPLNLMVRWHEMRPNGVSSSLAVGQRWALENDRLSLIGGSKVDIDLRAARLWKLVEPRWLLDQGKITDGLGRLVELLAPLGQQDGLLALILDPNRGPRNPVEQAAAALLRSLSHDSIGWFLNGDLSILSSLHDLLGLGPGLTPSGDDIIAGMLIASHYLGRGDAAMDLWHRLEQTARRRTTPISVAHLSAAAAGMGAAPFHRLLEALAKNQDAAMSEALDAVAKIGHCSGYDAVGGLVLLLRAMVAAGEA